MNLRPKRTKFRKSQKGSMRGMAKKGHFVSFGLVGIQAIGRGYISSKQVESARVAISRAMNREGKAQLRIFPDKPLTEKPIQTRMGKGKGGIKEWVSIVKPGAIIFEIVGSDNIDRMREALRKASAKLSVQTRFVEAVEEV